MESNRFGLAGQAPFFFGAQRVQRGRLSLYTSEIDLLRETPVRFVLLELQEAAMRLHEMSWIGMQIPLMALITWGSRRVQQGRLI